MHSKHPKNENIERSCREVLFSLKLRCQTHQTAKSFAMRTFCESHARMNICVWTLVPISSFLRLLRRFSLSQLWRYFRQPAATSRDRDLKGSEGTWRDRTCITVSLHSGHSDCDVLWHIVTVQHCTVRYGMVWHGMARCMGRRDVVKGHKHHQASAPLTCFLNARWRLLLAMFFLILCQVTPPVLCESFVPLSQIFVPLLQQARGLSGPRCTRKLCLIEFENIRSKTIKCQLVVGSKVFFFGKAKSVVHEINNITIFCITCAACAYSVFTVHSRSETIL